MLNESEAATEKPNLASRPAPSAARFEPLLYVCFADGDFELALGGEHSYCAQYAAECAHASLRHHYGPPSSRHSRQLPTFAFAE